MRSLAAKTKRTIRAGLLLLCAVFLLSGCISFRMKTVDDAFIYKFPETKWVCREADIVLYRLRSDAGGTLAFYTVDGVTYRGDAYFNNRWRLDFSIAFYPPDAEIRAKSFCNVYGGFHYDEEAGALVCSDVQRYRRTDDGETVYDPFPETLTFDCVGKIAEVETRDARWVADEMDLYLDSFAGVDGYYRGEIVLDKETYQVYLTPYPPERYGLYVTGFINVSSFWLEMTLDVSEDRIVATPLVDRSEDEHMFQVYYPRWYKYFDDITSITFHRTAIEE